MIGCLALGIYIGWVARNCSLKRIWKKKKFLVLEGDLFTIKKHKNDHVGGL
jgi:hypothetical protein